MMMMMMMMMISQQTWAVNVNAVLQLELVDAANSVTVT